MSGGNDTVTQTNFPDWAVPSAQNFLGRSQQVADLPYTPYTGSTVAQMNPLQTGALNATAQRAMQGSQEVGQARTQLGDTLSGGYMAYQPQQNQYFGSNPYLQSQIDQASNDVVRNYQTAIKPSLDAASARSGSFGNSGLQEMERYAQSDLARDLGDITNDFRFRDYSTQQQLGESAANRSDAAYQAERQRQLGAIGLAPSLANQDYIDAEQLQRAGQGFQTQEQLNLDDSYRRFQEAQNYPQQQLATLGKALGLNYGSTSSVPGNNGLAQGLGTALALYGGYKGLSGSGGGK